MNEQQLREFVRARGPGYSARHKETDGLQCYGCAHAAADGEGPPGRPSGERPCVPCVRNHEDWRVTEPPDPDALEIEIDDQGNARCFDPAAAFAYNGAPYPHWPPDNYVTMDANDRDRFYEQHSVYAKPITFKGGKPVVVD